MIHVVYDTFEENTIVWYWNVDIETGEFTLEFSIAFESNSICSILFDTLIDKNKSLFTILCLVFNVRLIWWSISEMRDIEYFRETSNKILDTWNTFEISTKKTILQENFAEKGNLPEKKDCHQDQNSFARRETISPQKSRTIKKRTFSAVVQV